MDLSADKIVAKLPINTLPKIVVELDYYNINKIIQSQNINSVTLSTNLGGRSHGQIVLIMRPNM